MSYRSGSSEFVTFGPIMTAQLMSHLPRRLQKSNIRYIVRPRLIVRALVRWTGGQFQISWYLSSPFDRVVENRPTGKCLTYLQNGPGTSTIVSQEDLFCLKSNSFYRLLAYSLQSAWSYTSVNSKRRSERGGRERCQQSAS